MDVGVLSPVVSVGGGVLTGLLNSLFAHENLRRGDVFGAQLLNGTLSVWLWEVEA